MDIDRYASEAWTHVHELLEQVRQCDLAALATTCRDQGRDRVAAAALERQNELLTFVAATPTQRKSLLRKVAVGDRPMFLLLALYHARCGLAFLETTARYGVGPGPAYRMVSAQAARAAVDLIANYPTLWPFDEGNPFPEEVAQDDARSGDE
ncbi:hypothetical protein [Azospirillum halopraeferens]|uniref:hypothetical protein n=1 Tax=Azospirillum halopraeferens TaxID=34010 RepID=UPI0012EBCEF0|nr:hypothetical protein [Azospirillum halopraeferens]